MKKYLIIVILTFISINVNVSGQTQFIRITAGNYLEEAFYDMPDAKLVNIFTTPTVTINQFNDYEFRLYGDTIGSAKWWVATYYDANDKVTSMTAFVPSATGYFKCLTWTSPLTDGFVKNCYFNSKRSIVITETAQFKSFVSAIKDNPTFVAAYENNSYAVGAGIPDSIVIGGEPLSFELDEPMYYFMAVDSATLTATCMCYQYFDSSDINCKYLSIKEQASVGSFISPNPSASGTTLTLDLLTAGNLTISLYNLLGEELLELHNSFTDAGIFSRTFSIEMLPIGVYYLKIIHNGNIKIEKVIKN